MALDGILDEGYVVLYIDSTILGTQASKDVIIHRAGYIHYIPMVPSSWDLLDLGELVVE